MHSILFVCLGNICRSPLAHGVALKVASQKSQNIVVDSAGTSSFHVGEPPCENSIKVAKMHGIEISSQHSRVVTQEDLKSFELIVALDESNYQDLVAMGAQNICKLGDFGYDGADVPDPYFYSGFEGFHEVYKMIEICVNNLFSVKSL